MNKKNIITHLGDDITQVRKELQLFVKKYIQDEANQKKYNKAIFESYDFSNEDTTKGNFLEQFFNELIIPIFISVFHSMSTVDILKKLEAKKHDLDYTKIAICEYLFYASKYNSNNKISLKNKKRQKDTIHLQRIIEIPNRLKEAGYTVNIDFEIFNSDTDDIRNHLFKPTDYGYEELFAYELRQKEIALISEFLSFHEKDHNSNFLGFLENILIEHRNLLEKKTRDAVKLWMKKAKKKQAKNISTTEVTLQELDNKEKDEIIFKQAPEGYTTFNGYLTPEEQLEFLSFLIKEKAPNGQALMSKSQFQDFIKYGPLVAPNENNKTETLIDLDLKNKKAKYIFYYTFFILYNLHAKNKNHKKLLSRILKYRIKGFNHLKIESIRSSMRLDAKPTKMSFSIDDYIPERIKESAKYRELQSAIK